MGEVASSIGLQAVVGALARTGDANFNLQQTLQALAEVAASSVAATGVAIERTRPDADPETVLTVGQLSGSPRRLPIISEGKEIGFIAIYGAPMFGPATADRTQIVADLAAIAFARGAAVSKNNEPPDDSKYRLITGVGHNLRNTLGAAVGYVQLVEMEGPLSASQQEYVSRSRRAINAAVSLIADLIELTRADAGKLSFDREPVNMNAIAREAVRKHRDTARAKQCEIEIAVPPRTPVLLTDSSYVQQIVDVLVYNAVRYTPPGGNIKVMVDLRHGRRANDPEEFVCVEVADNGPGVSDAENVFEEVHRVETSKGNVRFRLAICRRIARLLGGDLRLETEKDAGSTFTLWLPAPIAA